MKINNLSERIRKKKMQIVNAIDRVIESGWFVLGQEVQNFEKSFATYIGTEFCITVGNGTDAIELGLRSLGISRDDYVATVANAGMYTTIAILAIEAKPFYIDVDVNTNNVTLDEVNRAIKAGVKAVVVTHLYGLAVAEIYAISVLCKQNNVYLFEDCAQAHGAKIGTKSVGTFGDAASFSFYPTKNLGALGDGGAVVTNNFEIANRITSLRQYGWKSKYQVEIQGARNSRLDEIQASILSVFLPDLDTLNESRREIVKKYKKNINNEKILLPELCGENSVNHLYVARVEKRNAFQKYLVEKNIFSEIHYPIPDYRQPIFENRYSGLCLPNTEKLSKEIISIPCYPEMEDVEVQYVIDVINSWND